MPKVRSLPLSSIDTSTGECAKLNCGTGSRTLHRHHRRHEAMWLGVWASRRQGETKYRALVQRYHAFMPEDWTRVCDWHHAEIHLIYDSIIMRDRKITGRRLTQYSWRQANRLMKKLEEAFSEWLKIPTPGSDPEELTKLRQIRLRRKRS